MKKKTVLPVGELYSYSYKLREQPVKVCTNQGANHHKSSDA